MTTGRRMSIWRMAVVVSVLAMALAPTIPLMVVAATTDSDVTVWSRSFVEALLGSLLLAASVALLCLVVGFPLGLLAALYRFRLRAFLILFQI